MKKKNLRFPFIYIGLGLILLSFLSSCKTKATSGIDTVEDKLKSEYTVAAYVWPSCHHDERFGDMLWPDGEGEWEVIKKGNPRFEGHYQPKIPLWGYELDNDPKVMEK